MSELQRKAQMKGVSNMLPPMPPKGTSSGSRSLSLGKPRKRDFSQLPWNKYFDSSKDVQVDEDNVFRVYKRGTEGPVLLFLHGGGLSSLSWAVLASLVTKNMQCQCLAMDFRGHGETRTANEEDLSAETLANDVGNVITSLFGDEEVIPPIVMVGHSMGGAIAIHAAVRYLVPSLAGLIVIDVVEGYSRPLSDVGNVITSLFGDEEGIPPIVMVSHSMGGAIAIHAAVGYLVPSLAGLIVIDVVEGTAMEALQSMQSFLRGRPKQFKSLEYAIEWAVKTGQIRNLESARVSMAGQLIRCSTECTSTCSQVPGCSSSDAIAEEDEEEDNTRENTSANSPNSQVPVSLPCTWRVDLSKSESHWKGWFEGMSNLFLSCTVPKMLLIAGVNRLDTELTVGQMQGKFWMHVMPQCGHCLHEDQPQKVADVLTSFMVRNKLAETLNDFVWQSPAC